MEQNLDEFQLDNKDEAIDQYAYPDYEDEPHEFNIDPKHLEDHYSDDEEEEKKGESSSPVS